MPAKTESAAKKGITRSNTKPSLVPMPSPRKTRAMTARAVGPTEPPAPPVRNSAAIPRSKAAATLRPPFVARDNSPEHAQPPVLKKIGEHAKLASDSDMTDALAAVDLDQEPIKAFLRIRPNLGQDESETIPYLKPLSSTVVQMTEPIGSSSRFRSKMNTKATYTFSRVFPPDIAQLEFFTQTTLPLVRALLEGQNGLVFTYGVTNSGKTYTIQGGNEPNTAGLLPRTLDVMFNSVEGLHSDTAYKPVRVAGVEVADDHSLQDSHFRAESADVRAMTNIFPDDVLRQSTDSTKIPVDRNYEYSIWISYVEVYNEKIFDLLSMDRGNDEPTSPEKPARAISNKTLPRASTWQNLAALTTSNSSGSDSLLMKRKALTLKNDVDGGKYIAGLREVRVRSAEEAKALFREGKNFRRVFGTLANSASSRSHSIFTIKVLKIHRGAKNDMESVSSSRLSIVDLAGSERTKNTQNTGDRLREAGSINKSLMVLGQCMEALRNNQKRQAASAASLALPGRNSIRPFDMLSSRASIVPFRHSKLTELFQDFFVGERDGRAVMIVNVNPYDTGFDENSHVMKFAALAKEVKTTTNIPVAVKTFTSSDRQRDSLQTASFRRKVTLETKGKRQSEVHLEILEEQDDEDGDDDEPINPLVEALFDEVEDLRVQLYEAQLQCALVEAETREEVMKEMEERMMNMERIFTRRLRREAEQHAMKADAKIDMLHQFGAFSSRSNTDDEDTEGEEDFEEELQSTVASSREGTSSPTPYNGPSKANILSLGNKSAEKIGLMDDEMSIDELDADETMTKDGSETEEDEEEAESSAVNSEIDGEDEDEDEEWVPTPSDGSPEASSSRTRTTANKSNANSRTPRANVPVLQQHPSTKSRHSEQLSSIRERMQKLMLEAADSGDEDNENEELEYATKSTPKPKKAAKGSVRRSGRQVSSKGSRS